MLNLQFIQIEIQYTNRGVSELFQGEWKNGKRHGHGHFDFANGDKFTGEWLNDKRTKNGQYVYASFCSIL